jgi:hypothetical protein
MIVEYASVVAAMAVLVSSITGNLATLPTSTNAALTAVTSGAKAQKVSSAGARTAYKRAPYSKPILKYLYAVGWIGGKKSPLSCLFARVQRDDTEREALREIRRNPKLVRQLRRAHVSLGVAATTLVQGIASACS